MIKNYLYFFKSCLYLSSTGCFKKESLGKGFENTRSEAIKNAINDALGKTEGLKQVKLKKFEFNFNENFI
ncbi:hypothetical protein BHR28_01085 [Campylobacter lari]|nr:hypothetical protein [Campylobacter lari]